ncbi:hypothetical protein P6F15_02060 [Thiopseudomonas alkaliphila]|uniref:hypothetical protein n=1 Tax=Thiopseudomonas alkaliphila TaxID=1697053 RepID=UPI0035711D1C
MIATRINKIYFALIFGASVISGCSSIQPGGNNANALNVQNFEEEKSFAYNVSVLSHINTPKTSKSHIKDVVVTEADLKKGGSEDLLGVGVAAGMLSFPSSVGSSGMNSFMAIDMLLGSLAGPPTIAMNRMATIAWYPAADANSPKEAMDKFHSLRVEGVKKTLSERGMKVSEFTNKLDVKHTPWEDYRHFASFTVESFEDLCTKEEPCVFKIATRMPAKQTVIAPKEITGKPYEAYFFKSGDVKESSGYGLYKKGVWLDGRYGLARDFETNLWITKYQPSWSVHYVPVPRPEQIGSPMINQFPYMIHNGRVELFVKPVTH